MLQKITLKNQFLERQNIVIYNMKLFLKTILLVVLVIALNSCTKEIPKGDIKDFVDNINFDKTYEAIETARGTTTVSYYLNKNLEGQIISYTEIDKNNSYSYSKNEVSGSYYGNGVGQYNFNLREVVSYLDEDKMAVAYEKLDQEQTVDFKYTMEDVNLSYNNFFYTELESSYHRGGYYYGDYIHANCGKYYEYFSLSEDKKYLTYSINLLTEGPEQEEILTLHSFKVNEYGLIVELSSTVKNNAKGIVSTTTMACEYNIKIDKKMTL